MLTVKTKSDLRQALDGARLAVISDWAGSNMGNLHDGHLQLVRAAVADCQYTVASIFINPLQFGKSEDLNNYPEVWSVTRACCPKQAVTCCSLPISQRCMASRAR